MESLYGTTKYGLGIFISVYLPGLLVSIGLMIFVLSEANAISCTVFLAVIDKIIPLAENINMEIYIAYYFSMPFIAGFFCDGLRHCIGKLLPKSSLLGGLFRWQYLEKDAFVLESCNLTGCENYLINKVKLPESILLRRADKSYLLYYVYEFFGNMIIAMLTVCLLFSFIISQRGVLVVFGIIFTIVNLLLMWVYNKDNDELLKQWFGQIREKTKCDEAGK